MLANIRPSVGSSASNTPNRKQTATMNAGNLRLALRVSHGWHCHNSKKSGYTFAASYTDECYVDCQANGYKGI